MGAAALREHRVIDGVREERDGVRVRRDLAEEQVRERDVGDALLGEVGDVGGDLLGPVAEMEATLDRMDQRDRAVFDAPVEPRAVTDDADRVRAVA